MTKNSVVAIVLLGLLSINALSIMSSGKSAAATPTNIMVPTNAGTIQDAINMANENDTIKVAAGTYNENVIVNKSVTLLGDGQNVTYIIGNSITAVITVIANNVNVSGFTIKNGTEGVFLKGSNMSTISSNVMTNNRFVGIELLDSNINRISNNTVTFHENAPLHAQGIWSRSSNSNTVDGNILLNNAYSIDMANSRDNTFYANIISNGFHGVDLEECYSNTFYHNDFIKNTQQVSSYQSINNWDNGSEGNYWSDYSGGDNNGDGIGDTPYIINNDNKDNYPLMNRWHPEGLDVAAPVTTDNYDGLWHNQDFVITLAAEDVSGINATYYRINNAQTVSNVTVNGQPLITEESANNTLEYWSKDNSSNLEKPHRVLTGIKLDKTVPYGSILIDNGDVNTTSTSVTLNLFGNDTLSGITHMRFSNDEQTWTQWETYATTRTWVLDAGDGLKKVRAQYRDNAGMVSQTYNDTIVLDTAPPTISILSPSQDSEIRSSEVTVEWSGADAGVGVDHYETRLDSSSWENTGTLLDYTFARLSDGAHTVYVKAVDKLGHTSEASVSFIANTSPIGGPGYLEEAALALIAAVVIGIVVYALRVRRKDQMEDESSLSAET